MNRMALAAIRCTAIVAFVLMGALIILHRDSGAAPILVSMLAGFGGLIILLVNKRD